MKKSKYKISDNLYKCECGREFNKSQSLNAHFIHCDIHCKCINKTRNDKHKGTMNWENKSQKEIEEIYNKSHKTLINNIKSGKTIYNGHKHSEETKDKIRIAHIKNHKIINTGPLYNKKSIEYINNINKNYNWNLQHAENGGEIMCGGYYLDGYDKNLNIVFEYDERKHYKDVKNNILRDYDINRMKRIKEILNCDFYRYNEYLDLFYKVENL